MTCHETHVQMFQEKNVHRQFKCEECHGPASEHIASRGQEVGKILNVRRLKPAERSEICLRCHEKEIDCRRTWRSGGPRSMPTRTSPARIATALTMMLPKGTPTVTPPRETSRPRQGQTGTKRHGPEGGPARPHRGLDHDSSPDGQALNSPGAGEARKPSLRGTSAEPGSGLARRLLSLSPGLASDERTDRPPPDRGYFRIQVHDVPRCSGNSHTPDGERALPELSQRSLELELALVDAQRGGPALYRLSQSSSLDQSTSQRESQAENHGGGASTDVPCSRLRRAAKCHEQTKPLVEIADPHQVGGTNNFQCTTCHDPHGKIVESTRQELCLTCHTGTPTAAWHSSTSQPPGNQVHRLPRSPSQ